MFGDVALQIITGAIGGAVVSSIIAPYVLQSRERRTARAEVMKAILNVERYRWVNSEESTYYKFNDAVIELKATAMIAGVDPDVVDKYVYLASVARSASQHDVDEGHDPEFAGGISSKLADLTRDSASVLMKSLRSPMKSRLGKKKALRDIDKRIQSQKRSKASWQHAWNVRTL